MAEFVDIVIYREEDSDPWNVVFVEGEDGQQVNVGTWLPMDEDGRRVLRIQSDDIRNI